MCAVVVDIVPCFVDCLVGGRLFQSLHKSDFTSQESWVYVRLFQVIVNDATGGTVPGAATSRPPFHATMLGDYVRVTTTSR